MADPSSPAHTAGRQGRIHSFVPIGRTTAALVAVLGVSACALVPFGQGNPGDPVVVTGRVLDDAGNPAGGVQIDLQVNDYGAEVEVGDAVPIVFRQSFTSSPDGSFALHLAPTPALLAFGAKEGGFVNFTLYAFSGKNVATWGFTRHLEGNSWTEEPEFVELRPLGAAPGVPGVPAPEPTAT